MGWYLERVALGVAATLLVVNVLTPGGYFQPEHMGHDFTLYQNAARSWLAGAGFYPASELAGPFTVMDSEVLYPPTILPLLVPFTVLPAVLWWAIPIAAIGWSLRRVRSLWAWAAILGILALPKSLMILTTGNPTLWVTAGVALGLPLALWKPTLIPFALVGAGRKRWWAGLALMAIAALLFAPMMVDWLRVLGNARGPLVSPLYSLADVPFVLIGLAQKRPQHVRQVVEVADLIRLALLRRESVPGRQRPLTEGPDLGELRPDPVERLGRDKSW